MKRAREFFGWLQLCGRIITLLIALAPALLQAAAEETYPVLQAGSQVYSNVTVTSKTSSYVIVRHAQGMTSIKLSELPVEVLKELGYKVEKPHPRRSVSSLVSSIALDPRVQELRLKITQIVQERLRETDPVYVQAAFVVFVLAYSIFCYCCMLICKKTGYEPGVLVWIPVLRFLPLLKAARMSHWCFLLLLVPGINVLVAVVWCFKICRARGKSAWLGLALLLPVANIFTFLYLAFADRTAKRSKAPEKIRLAGLSLADQKGGI